MAGLLYLVCSPFMKGGAGDQASDAELGITRMKGGVGVFVKESTIKVDWVAMLQ